MVSSDTLVSLNPTSINSIARALASEALNAARTSPQELSCNVLTVAHPTHTVVPSGQAEELGAIFESGGADLSISWRQGGHELVQDDVRAAKTWLSKDKVRKRVAA